MKKTLLILAGPTAVGKTSLAIELAKYFQTEIVSADSRQFYRELRIGTAKPSKHELQTVKHHFIDSHSIQEDVNAGKYAESCSPLLEDLFNKFTVVIMTGGSGLFIHSAIYGLDELPPADHELRKELQKKFEEEGIESLQAELRTLDPQYYKMCDINNPRRLIRGIEVNRQSPIPYSQLLGQKKIKSGDYNIVYIGLNLDREVLYDRINRRVDQMMEDGLLQEAKSVHPYKGLNSLKSVGYRELFDFLDQKISLDEAVELIKKNSRNYAKRQITWFKKVEDIQWFEPNQKSEIIDLVRQQS